MKPLSILLFILSIAFFADIQHVNAQGVRPVALVNDDIITGYDLEKKIQLTILESGIPNNQTNRQKMQEQVLNTAIDDLLKIQEANRLGLRVTDGEINKAMGQIAKQNGKSLNAFLNGLAKRGISKDTLASQLRAQISWSKVVGSVLRPKVRVLDEDVAVVNQRIAQNQGKRERRVSEIFLAGTSQQTRNQANRLVSQLKSGAKFAALAQQFSQSSSAAVGGDMGWISDGQLQPKLDKVVRTMGKNQISNPILTDNGYYILGLRDVRKIGSTGSDNLIRVSQYFVPLPKDLNSQHAQEAIAHINTVRQVVKGCKDLNNRAKKINNGSGDMGLLNIADLPKEVSNIVGNLKIGKASDLTRIPGGAAFFMVCERKTQSRGKVDGDSIREGLFRDRLNTLAQRYLRDLRQSAFIQKRI